jgi:hypothetical protein
MCILPPGFQAPLFLVADQVLTELQNVHVCSILTDAHQGAKDRAGTRVLIINIIITRFESGD